MDHIRSARAATECVVIPARVLATCFALAAFAASLAVGVYVGNDAATVMGRGIAVLLGCYLIGLIVGSAAQRAIDDHTRRHEENNPVPQSVGDLPEAVHLHDPPPTAPTT